ncbi:MAG: GNAT family N-acetyltransferase [Peptostreptococcaceae bacterium]|nr:GNAT family N-acetyltransferase [Peptostreptococcaceae bacterium]
MEKRKYLDNPTGASALSFWKTCNYKKPAHIKVVHESEFDYSLLETHIDEIYFKLVHYLEDIEEQCEYDRFIFVKASTEEFVNHINSCYEEEGLTVSELESYKSKPVYDEDLWICLYDKENDAIAATGIAEFDNDVEEGYLDWIQVSEGYRGRGLGKIIVYELLRRLKKKAGFVTVSGRADNKTKPEKLYESCGFGSKVLWHILIEKNQ